MPAIARGAQLVLLALCLGQCGQAAHGWMHTRGRGQVQLPSTGNRHLKSHPHGSVTGIALQEPYHSRWGHPTTSESLQTGKA